MNFRDVMTDVAVATWRELASTEGLDPDDYTPKLLSARREGGEGCQNARLVLLLCGNNQRSDLIMKQRVGSESGKGVSAMVLAHAKAAAALKNCAEFGVPRVKALDANSGAVLLTRCLGEPARDILLERDSSCVAARLADILAQCGAWMGAFHRGGRLNAQKFSPDAALAGLRNLADGRQIPDHVRYLRHLGQLAELGADLKGKACRMAMTHGDLTLANILIAFGQVAGIDFESDDTGPVARDVATLLADASVWFGHDLRGAQGEFLPEPQLSAFWGAYDDRRSEESLVKFFWEHGCFACGFLCRRTTLRAVRAASMSSVGQSVR